jgi:hypothetical protein
MAWPAKVFPWTLQAAEVFIGDGLIPVLRETGTQGRVMRMLSLVTQIRATGSSDNRLTLHVHY